ncbi:acyl-CoA N-acyltransferase [Peniophora sp. CONT]|nr:acyl-CoA N-acyltransferase [Peniophora sp. CONT]
MPSISLRSTRYPELELRTATLEDAPAVREIFTNPANTALDPVVNDPARFTVEKIESMIQRWAKSQEEEKPGGISIVVVVDGAVQGIGGMGHIATDKETGKRTGDAGVMLNEVARRKGYGAEAMRLTTDYAFDVMKLDKVTATMLAKNEPMAELMRKMGWKGRLIPAEEGEFGEEWMFTMMPEEWAELRKAGKA